MGKPILFKQKLHKWHDEDIWGFYSTSSRNSRALLYLYTSFSHNFQKRKLLKKKKFFLKNKKFRTLYRPKFAYHIHSGEIEFKRKRRNLRAKNFFNLIKLRLFYGNVKVRPFQNQLQTQKKGRNFLDTLNPLFAENKLSTLLYRTNLFPSVFTIKQFLQGKNILVNGHLTTNQNKALQIGDIVTIHPKIYPVLYAQFLERLAKRKLLTNYPSYLEIDYSIGSFVLATLPTNAELHYPFSLSSKSLLHQYRK